MKILMTSGMFVDPHNCNPGPICFRDIARLLARTNVMPHLTEQPVSYAQVSLILAEHVKPELKTAALIYNLSETLPTTAVIEDRGNLGIGFFEPDELPDFIGTAAISKTGRRGKSRFGHFLWDDNKAVLNTILNHCANLPEKLEPALELKSRIIPMAADDAEDAWMEAIKEALQTTQQMARAS